MPVQFCEWCDRIVDLDYDVEHFDEEGRCVIHLEDLEAEEEEENDGKEN